MLERPSCFSLSFSCISSLPLFWCVSLSYVFFRHLSPAPPLISLPCLSFRLCLSPMSLSLTSLFCLFLLCLSSISFPLQSPISLTYEGEAPERERGREKREKREERQETEGREIGKRSIRAILTLTLLLLASSTCRQLFWHKFIFLKETKFAAKLNTPSYDPSTTLPLYYHTAIPLHRYAATPLRQYTATPLRQYTATLLHHYIAIPPRHYTATLFHRCTAIPLHLWIAMPLHGHTAILLYRCNLNLSKIRFFCQLNLLQIQTSQYIRIIID